MTIPSLDQNTCGDWTEQQIDLYNKLPFYLMEAESKFRKRWITWKPLLGTINWKANSGDTMRRVMAEPTPIMRQETYPRLISQDPLVDIINYRERKSDTQLAWQDFESPHFSFLPEFQDFMRHIDNTIQNINMQVTHFEDIFYRTMLFHYAPYVYICGTGLVAAPTGKPTTTGTGGKSNAWLQGMFAGMSSGQPGYLSFENLWLAMNAFETEVGATPYEGTGKPAGDSNPLNERYALVIGGQEWNNFTNDPWVKENRPLAMDIVTGAFKGDFFGRIRSKIERWPIYYAVDGDFFPSLPPPELTEENPDRENYGQTVPNTDYSKPQNAPFGVAFLLGNSPADAVNPGPPPPEFTRDLDQGSAVKMNWNGKTYLTKNFLIPCIDADGNRTWKTNSHGRYLVAQSTINLAISLINTRNVLPIIFKRRVGVTTVA